MLMIAALLAAGHPPARLASADESRWRNFTRASLSAPSASQARMDHLTKAVRRLSAESSSRQNEMAGGDPSGL
jgi:hypothetical protein